MNDTKTPRPPTAKQRAVLAAIVRHMAAHGGQAPAVRDLLDVVGTVSTQGVQHHLDSLRANGLIQTSADTGTARGIRVVGLADVLERAVRDWAEQVGIDITGE